jgi:hypothetical protein
VDDRGSIHRRGREFLSLRHCVHVSSGAHSVSKLMGTGGGNFPLGIKPEADHSSTSSDEIKNAWNYTSTAL